MREQPRGTAGPGRSVRWLPTGSPAVTAAPYAAPAGGGGHCRDTRPVAPPTPAAEDRARQDVGARLARRFPDTPPEVLDAVLAEEFAAFASAPLRHYVPVLVFKRVCRRLAGDGPAGAEAGGEPE
ncbi:hypothetical protein KBZ10_11715 [Streptomyces sp. F63]|uniref:three-helix bundle dimerization domain-containing protein n=1 Tax=Streptomyces sp. F63 TaxID=2824887 RepID=UPI001B3828F1|nr:hypothetical protein [Streptomyces sp. F63]MBQ0985175.1 hypothetical protein [Streptomyces sp. F63]